MAREKFYMLFFSANALWLGVFALFSLRATLSVAPLIATGLIVLHVLIFFMYGVFSLQMENKNKYEQWLYIGIIILIGFILRVALHQIYQPAQIQDFGRAHDALVFLREQGPLQPIEGWVGHSYYALYYSRFPGWFPFFVVTRVVYGIFGFSTSFMIGFNFILFIGSALLLFMTTRRLFSYAISFCATAIFIFNPILLVWSSITTPDHFYIIIFFGMIYCFVRAHEGEGKRPYYWLCVAAVLAALTEFFKPIGILFLIAYVCTELFLWFIKKTSVIQLYRRWGIFIISFLIIYLAGGILVRAEIRRVFHIETVSATGMYMAFAWASDDAGNHNHSHIFGKFDELMIYYNNNQVLVMQAFSQYARESFREVAPRLPVFLWQKARDTFAGEGVMWWVSHSHCEERTAATRLALNHMAWMNGSTHIFVLMAFAAMGAFLAAGHKKNRAFTIFVLTTAIGYTLVLLLGVVQMRYRILLYPQFSILAGIAAVWLVNQFFVRVLKNGGTII